MNSIVLRILRVLFVPLFFWGLENAVPREFSKIEIIVRTVVKCVLRLLYVELAEFWIEWAAIRNHLNGC